MKPFLVPFTFEVGKTKIADSLTVFANTQPEAIDVFNHIIKCNPYVKVAYKEGFAVVKIETAKLKIGKVKEG